MKQALFNTKTVLIAGITTACLFAFISQLHFSDSSQNFLGETKRAELSPNGPITQVFQANRNGLEGIQIFMGDTELSLGERIDFTLLDPSCQNILSQSSRTFLSPQIVRDIRFIFPVLSKSNDETYCLSIEYHSGLIKKKERPYVRVAEDKTSDGLSYTDHGKGKTYTGRTLQIRPMYAPEDTGISSRFMELENRLSQYKPAFMKGYMLTLGALSLLFGFSFFVWIARQKD
ncbi:MAG: hypothetical protein ACEQSB_02140 [Undibacterium sp.]